MNQVTAENHMTAKRDDVEATVNALMSPATTVHDLSNRKEHMTRIVSELYDRAVAEGRYLEIVEPSTPDEPEELPLVPHKHKLRAKYKNDLENHE
jgi:hypothetical protein